MATITAQPVSDIDLFSTENLIDPFPAYAQLRDTGPAVWMQRHDLWAVSRYDDVRSALRDWRTFTSSEGVALNPVVNEAIIGSVLASDPPAHDRMREVLASRLTPRALRPFKEQMESQAEVIVDAVNGAGDIDGVDDIATAFPLSVVFDLIGFPDEGRPHILKWADAQFDAFGPMNEQTQGRFPAVQEMMTFLVEGATAQRVKPGSFAATIHDAIAAGTVTPPEGLNLLAAFSTAGLDTTINSISAALLLFAQNPDQWDHIRANVGIVPSAYNEVLRLATPVKLFMRKLRYDYSIDGVAVPEGSWVAMIYASANRDERHFPNPDKFDIRRNSADHLTFGIGVHNCAGQALARLEAHALLAAMARKVRRFELVGEAEWSTNQIIRGLRRLPIRLVPA